VTHDETVIFLQRLGIQATDIFDDDPAELWITRAGLRRLCDAAPDDAGTFSVRALLNGGTANAGITITIRTERDQTPRPNVPNNRKDHRAWLRRYRNWFHRLGKSRR